MGLFFSSCSKFNDDINTNPNKPTVASGTKLIANAEFYLQDMSSNAYGNLYPQYLSNTTFTEDARYSPVYFNYYPWYTGPMMNLETVINSGSLDIKEGPIVNQIAVAKILKAYFLWHVTDRCGNLSFSQALKGKDLVNPVYDKQQDIYTGIFKLLDEANASIVVAGGNNKNDFMHNGDMTSWKKFGN